MIFLYRESDDTPAAAETEETAARLEQQGYERCDLAAFTGAWRRRDERAIERLRSSTIGQRR